MVTAVYEIWNSSVAGITGICGINWAMTIQPFPGAFSNQTAELGGNSLGLSPTAGPQTLFLLSYNWASPSDDATVIAAAQALIAAVDNATTAAGHFVPFKYLNYAASWQNPIAGYGTASVARLHAVSHKYDPHGLFQTACPGGFKVSAVSR
jgi:hypothetical protein